MKKGRNHFWVLAKKDSDGQFGLRYYIWHLHNGIKYLRDAEWYTSKRYALLDRKDFKLGTDWKPIKVTIHL